METLFRLSGGVRRSPHIDAWLADVPVELRPIAREWFGQMRRCGDDVVELMQDGCPVACVQDLPFGYVNAFSAHVNVGFFQGAILDDPAGLLHGDGKRMRHVKVRPGTQLDAAALRQLIEDAYEHARMLQGA